MINNILHKISIFLILIPLTLNSCANRGDARKSPPNPDERVAKNMAEGRGFRLMDKVKTGRGGNFEFASSNELWRASLDVIDFMPLTSANYSGGIIITDWYSDNENDGESIKFVIRFLTNEIRSDALDLKIFYKNCDVSNKCKITEKDGNLSKELKKQILKKATVYQKQAKIKKDD
jgi:hypothetical protein